jgi:hypothetical protein
LNAAVQRGDNILLATDPAAHTQLSIRYNFSSRYLNLEFFFITLSKTNLNLEDIGDIREDEIGLGHFALHDGYDLLHHSLDSLENWQQALKESADAARELCVPYLQGKRNDFEEIRENARRKGEEAARPFQQICFPPNVIKKW